MRAFNLKPVRGRLGVSAPPSTAEAERAAPAAVARTTARRLESRGLLFVVGLFVALRVYLSSVGLLAFALFPPVWANLPEFLHRGFEPMREGAEAAWLGLWVRWDANWYMEIAREGYQAGDGSVVFPPLFPLLSRLAGDALGGSPLRGGMLVANLACLSAMLLFHRLARLDLGEAGARRALLWLVLFPTSLYLFVPYTESLYLALALGAFLGARTGRWPLAICLGALAALTRVPGATLAGPLLLELCHEPALRWWRARRFDRPEAAGLVLRALPLALIPAALGLYAAYAYVVVGDHLLWGHLETFWELHFAPPWVGFLGDARFLLNPPVLEGTEPVPWINEGTNRLGPAVDLFVGPALAVLGLVGLWRLRPSYSLYLWLLFFSATTKIDVYDLTQSLARYALVIFPAFILLGQFRLPRPLASTLLVTAVALLGFLTACYVHWWWLW